MKTTLISKVFFMILLACFTIPSLAKNTNSSSPDKVSKKLDVKCHVALINGNETIVFWRTTADKLTKLGDHIIDKKVSIPKVLDKVKIYRVFECVLEKEEFSTLRARTLDDKTPR